MSGLTFHIYSKYNLQSLILPGDKRLQPCCVLLTSTSLWDGQRLMRSLSIQDMLHLSGGFVFGMISRQYLFFCNAFEGGLLLFGEPRRWGYVAASRCEPETDVLQKYIHSNWLSTFRDIAHKWLITAGKQWNKTSNFSFHDGLFNVKWSYSKCFRWHWLWWTHSISSFS